MQTVEDAEDTLFQSSTTHDTVIDNHKIIHSCFNATIGHIIYVTRQIIAAISFGNKGTELDILPCYLFRTHKVAKYIIQFFFRRDVIETGYLLYLAFIEILLETAQHAILSHLGCVRDVAEHGVIYIVIHCLQDRLGQLLAQLLALLVDILIGTTTEVDALE